jgi:preprotein translocase subunit SecE
MNEHTTVQDSTVADKAKITVTILLVIGGIAAYYLLSGQAAWMRWVAVVAGIVLGLAIFASARQGRNFWQFMLDSRIELRKVVWPSREDTGKMTLVVFFFVIVAGVFFWALDLVLAWATRVLTGQGGG